MDCKEQELESCERGPSRHQPRQQGGERGKSQDQSRAQRPRGRPGARSLEVRDRDAGDHPERPRAHPGGGWSFPRPRPHSPPPRTRRRPRHHREAREEGPQQAQDQSRLLPKRREEGGLCLRRQEEARLDCQGRPQPRRIPLPRSWWERHLPRRQDPGQAGPPARPPRRYPAPCHAGREGGSARQVQLRPNVQLAQPPLRQPRG
mmetsp:Transcript_59078/g.175646  ORF Transcript_59078/g.175646 Transcript_59078/m.175646 type:complete len:204 (+) Transcript_59078:454-1065(+)